MVQECKEYQKEYFESENYKIFDSMEAAVDTFCKLYPQHSHSVAEESILNDTNCDWILLNDGSVAVHPLALKPEKWEE